jgi:hypothetical protein
MKTISRKDLIAMSVAIFGAHNVNTLFATSDGQFFIVQDRAKLHSNSSKAKLTIYEIDRHEADALSAKVAEPKSETKAETQSESKPKTKAKKTAKGKAKPKGEPATESDQITTSEKIEDINVESEEVKSDENTPNQNEN